MRLLATIAAWMLMMSSANAQAPRTEAPTPSRSSFMRQWDLMVGVSIATADAVPRPKRLAVGGHGKYGVRVANGRLGIGISTDFTIQEWETAGKGYRWLTGLEDKRWLWLAWPLFIFFPFAGSQGYFGPELSFHIPPGDLFYLEGGAGFGWLIRAADDIGLVGLAFSAGAGIKVGPFKVGARLLAYPGAMTFNVARPECAKEGSCGYDPNVFLVLGTIGYAR